MCTTIMQSLTFIISIVSAKIIMLTSLPHIDNQLASWRNTYYYTDSHFSCESKVSNRIVHYNTWLTDSFLRWVKGGRLKKRMLKKGSRIEWTPKNGSPTAERVTPRAADNCHCQCEPSPSQQQSETTSTDTTTKANHQHTNIHIGILHQYTV